MSADNCIVIVSLADGYMVRHLQAVENLWFCLSQEKFLPSPVVTRIFEYFHDINPIFSKEEVDVAVENLNKEISFIEYGTVEISLLPLTWDDVVELAKGVIEKELESQEDLPENFTRLMETKLLLYDV